MKEKKNIELRSEKVRSIIGQVPSVLLRYGIALIGIVLILLVGMAAFIPYKETISIAAKVETSPKSVLLKANRAGQILWDSKSVVVREGEVLGYELAQDSLYVIQASLSGKLSRIVQNGDAITKGEALAVIMPEGNLTYYAIAKVPQSLIVKVNQDAKLLFNSSKGIIVGSPSKKTHNLCHYQLVDVDNFIESSTVSLWLFHLICRYSMY